jgi:hypothetical protein
MPSSSWRGGRPVLLAIQPAHEYQTTLRVDGQGDLCPVFVALRPWLQRLRSRCVRRLTQLDVVSPDPPRCALATAQQARPHGFQAATCVQREGCASEKGGGELVVVVGPPAAPAVVLLHAPGPLQRRDGVRVTRVDTALRGCFDTVESCSPRSSLAMDASAVSDWLQSGYGAKGTSPSMNTRRSRPSSSTPTGKEAPSNPACLTARRKAWIEPECGVEGRRTCGPTRTTRPTFAIPPSSCCSATRPLLIRRRTARHVADR